MKGHVMVKNLPEKVSFEKVMPQYEKLLMLKKALMLSEDEEVNEKILLERSREHNLREIYLDLVVVQDILGHSKVSTTQRYAHPVPERKMDAVEILSSYFSEQTKPS